MIDEHGFNKVKYWIKGLASAYLCTFLNESIFLTLKYSNKQLTSAFTLNPTLRVLQEAVTGGRQAVWADRGVNVGAVKEQLAVTELW